MQFRTEIKVNRVSPAIQHSDAILAIGSCFAENMSTLLQNHFFQVLENPFGVLYNPLSIAKSLMLIMENRKFTPQDLFFYQEQWHSFWHHSSFSHSNQQICLEQINQQMTRAHNFLRTSNWLIVTFGTAFVYFHQKSKQVVANCHKLPDREFQRRLISITAIVSEWQTLLERLKQFNPALKIIFSVSPIRHLRDGLVENQKSKSTLILATHQLVKPKENRYYFPAYEILMDDLRDYRFYQANLTHPNEQAVQYIWEKFQSMFFTENTLKIVNEFIPLKKRLAHRFQNPNSEQALRFKTQTKQLAEKLVSKYPYVADHPLIKNIFKNQ